jgi:hypothetical protein
MFIRALYAAAVIALVLSVNADAQTPSKDHGRYTMSPTKDGFLRLDTETGAVALCTQSESGWACNSVADHTNTSSSGELSRLEDENRELKDRVKELEANLEANTPPPGSLPPLEGPSGATQLPTEEQVDQALDYLEHVYQKIRDRIKKLDEPPPAENAKPDTGAETPLEKHSL